MSMLRIFVLLLAWLSACVADSADQAVPPGILVLSPRPAPALRLADMDGEAFDLGRRRRLW